MCVFFSKTLRVSPFSNCKSFSRSCKKVNSLERTHDFRLVRTSLRTLRTMLSRRHYMMPYPLILPLKEAYHRGNITLNCLHELPCGWPSQTSKDGVGVCLTLTFPKHVSSSHDIAASQSQFEIGFLHDCSDLPTCNVGEGFGKIEISHRITHPCRPSQGLAPLAPRI